ncbi:MAG: hypothetical protein WBM53_01150 [Maribacter sp.]
MKNQNISIQEYLSIGYIFLLFVGIVYQSIFYSFFSINILSYSSLLDVLLSPISVISENLTFLGTLVVFVIFGIYFVKVLGPKLYQWQRKQAWYRKIFNVEKWDRFHAKAQENSNTGALIYACMLVLAIFIGSGVGGGGKLSQKMQHKELKSGHNVVFEDSETLDIKIIGQNTLYLFYVIDGEDKLSVSPIEGNIKKITMLKSK